MRHHRLRAGLFLLPLVLVGCAGEAVGAPCVPEQIPEGGFVGEETYVESNSPQCETRLCIVRGLDGDPGADCAPETCASETEVRDRVYCTVACGGDGDCPEGFLCESAGPRDFCVRDLPRVD